MIESNPSNVSSGFEVLLEEVEAEIDFFTRIGSRAFESRDFRKVDEVHTHALLIKRDEAVLNRSNIAPFCFVKCSGKPIFTFDVPANVALIERARRVSATASAGHSLKKHIQTCPIGAPHNETNDDPSDKYSALR